jgi:hypothetical protein
VGFFFLAGNLKMNNFFLFLNCVNIEVLVEIKMEKFKKEFPSSMEAELRSCGLSARCSASVEVGKPLIFSPFDFGDQFLNFLAPNK